MRRSEAEILTMVYERSGQIRLRRNVLRLLSGVVAAALVLTVSPAVFKQLAMREIETTNQPPADKSSREVTAGDVKTTDSGSPAAALDQRAIRTREPAKSEARSGGSVSKEAVPADFTIAFNRGREDMWEEDATYIYVTDTNASAFRVLRSGANPSWSWDGEFIAFTERVIEGGEIHFMNADGSGLHSLRVRGYSPSWSPDGARIVFSWECDPDLGTACASTDGSKNDCGPECGIGFVGRNGSGAKRLGSGIWPDWGPHGRIIFGDGLPSEPCGHYRAGFSNQLQCALPLWVMNSDGSGRTRLPIDAATSPTWSHDGKRIAYYTDTGGVFVANADGTGVVKVAPRGYEQPSWSPDGLWLALTRYPYTDQIDGREGYHHIVLRRVDGSGEFALTSGTNDLFSSFAPRP